jgi:uncharacterized membrane protein YqjE
MKKYSSSGITIQILPVIIVWMAYDFSAAFKTFLFIAAVQIIWKIGKKIRRKKK